MRTSRIPLTTMVVMAAQTRVGPRQARFAPNARTIPAAANGRTKGAAPKMRPEVECPRDPQPSVPPSKYQTSKYAAAAPKASASVSQLAPGSGLGWARPPSYSLALAPESWRRRLPLWAKPDTAVLDQIGAVGLQRTRRRPGQPGRGVRVEPHRSRGLGLGFVHRVGGAKPQRCLSQ
jgi:hypothetical protein